MTSTGETTERADMIEQVHVLLQGIVGSTAYGLAGPNSDIDQIGVFAYDTDRLFDLNPLPESRVTTKPDLALHEAAKYCRLALSANPTVTELLYLECYEATAPLGRDLIAIRSAFLSATPVRKAYLGYAGEQFRRLTARGDGSFSADTRKRTAKHARHLMRLVDQGYELYTTGTVTIRLAEPQRYLDFGNEVATDPRAAAPFMAEAQERFADARTVLPAEPDLQAVQGWVRRVRARYYAPESLAAAALEDPGRLRPPGGAAD